MKLNITPALLFGGDLLAMFAAFAASFGISETIYSVFLGEEFMPFLTEPTHAWLWLYGAVVVASLTLFAVAGHYTQRSPWWQQVKCMVVVSATMLLLSGSILYVLKMPFSRLWVVVCIVMVVPMLIAMRLIARRIALAMGQWVTQVTIIGGPENALETVFALSSDTYNMYQINEIYLLGTNAVLAKEALPTRQKNCKQALMRSEQLAGVIKKSSSKLFVAAPDEATRMDVGTFTLLMQEAGYDFAFVPPMSGTSLYGMEVQHFFGSHTVLLKPKRKVEKPLNRFFKRTLDLVGASLGMLALSVPMLVIAMMIRKDGGPILYYQERVGRHGKPFKCWKLRSMVTNSQEVLKELLAKDPEAKKEWETDFKLKNDPRVTKVGQIIRKTSFDELPQLWNVLKGEMSLVGPRPIVTKELEYYGKNKADYLAAKPGLTGLWQVSGRNDTSYAYRVYLDSWYVAHWSLWTDIVIIVETVGILVSRKGAY